MQELEKYSEILANKLKLTEKQLKKNNLQLNTLLRDLQHKLLKLDAYDVDAIMKSSQDEAVRLALMLKDRPAPPMPYFESNSIYDQQLEVTYSLPYSLTFSLTHSLISKEGCIRQRFSKGLVLMTISTSTTSGRSCWDRATAIKMMTISY